jgi:hypothetical protein
LTLFLCFDVFIFEDMSYNNFKKRGVGSVSTSLPRLKLKSFRVWRYFCSNQHAALSRAW